MSEADVPRLSQLKSAESEKLWTFEGQINLIDLEVVMGHSQTATTGYRFDILSPEHSFALYVCE